ncbi:hypothetical protein BV95_03571 [Sphingobium chlorophenolicum]|uniref:Uncharacterized protein n=1 Tax=Sphingobium chlorophenolicum TaxID=46429 RepID=A0A081RAD1_SPHCR|nr:hypothetical protein BV95_03571 [Sphingobium chlorophenolicum]
MLQNAVKNGTDIKNNDSARRAENIGRYLIDIEPLGSLHCNDVRTLLRPKNQ